MNTEAILMNENVVLDKECVVCYKNLLILKIQIIINF